VLFNTVIIEVCDFTENSIPTLPFRLNHTIIHYRRPHLNVLLLINDHKTKFTAHPSRILLHYGSCKETLSLFCFEVNPSAGHDSAGDCISLAHVFHSLNNLSFNVKFLCGLFRFDFVHFNQFLIYW
jgi:hypothetical protein